MLASKVRDHSFLLTPACFHTTAPPPPSPPPPPPPSPSCPDPLHLLFCCIHGLPGHACLSTALPPKTSFPTLQAFEAGGSLALGDFFFFFFFFVEKKGGGGFLFGSVSFFLFLQLPSTFYRGVLMSRSSAKDVGACVVNFFVNSGVLARKCE